MLYIKTFFPPSHLYLFVLLQQTVMQYQLSDDLPSALPFRLFPTIERDNGGRSDSSRVHYPNPVPARFLIVLFDSIKHSWMTHSCCTEVRVMFFFFFLLPCRLLMYLKLRCDLPPKRSVWISHVCAHHPNPNPDRGASFTVLSRIWSNIDYLEIFW